MGSPETDDARLPNETPQHRIVVSRPFYMGVHEVTQDQVVAIMGRNPSIHRGDSRPVEFVSWHDAVLFCSRATTRTGRRIRLPTEAEWEYACRAGTRTSYATGESITTDMANIRPGHGNHGDDATDNAMGTVPVGSYFPNRWGLFDMHGNVREWCADRYGPYRSTESTDPRGPSQGTLRVQRGGAWDDVPLTCRSAARVWAMPGVSSDNVGFRVVIEIPEESSSD